MDWVLACVFCAIGFGLWRVLAGRPRAAATAKRSPRTASPGVERLAVGSRTAPTSLTFRQRNVLAAADKGHRIIPTSESESHSLDNEGRYFFGRRTVASLIRAGFLEYATDGYRITNDGRTALAKLPERSN